MSDLLFGREDPVGPGKPRSPPVVAPTGGLRAYRGAVMVRRIISIRLLER
jgi:hypothetical protein